MQNDLILNWTKERAKIATFFEGESSILHVRGGAECQPYSFSQVLKEIAEITFGKNVKYSTLNVGSTMSGSPLMALYWIAKDLGFKLRQEMFSKSQVPIEYNIMSGIKSRGNVSIENSPIKIVSQSRHEGNELIQCIEFLKVEFRKKESLRGCIVHFAAGHEMEDQMRGIFWNDLWVSVLQDMIKIGLKVIFDYCPRSLEIRDRAVPVKADMILNLPPVLDDEAVIHELARYWLENGLAKSAESAQSYAKALVLTSDTAEELYRKVASLELKLLEAES